MKMTEREESQIVTRALTVLGHREFELQGRSLRQLKDMLRFAEYNRQQAEEARAEERS